MKKIMKCLFVTLTATSIFIGCNKEEEKQKESNPHAGTSWGKSYDGVYSDWLEIITFAEDTYQYYKADLNGNYMNSLSEGSYSYSGNEILINHHRIRQQFLDQYITGATVEGSNLVLHYYTLLSSGDTSFSNTTFMKR